MIGMSLLMFGLVFDNKPPEEKVPKLLLFGFLQGASFGSLIELAFYVDPLIVLQAFLATVFVFFSFAGVATFSQRRSFFYLYGTLASALSWLTFTSFLNIFFQSQILFHGSLYIGLAVFVSYVILDTQMIIERADLGDRDYVKHALELFLDLAAIFVRMLIIFLKMREDSAQRERKRRRE
jgi:FtsH-binding integral membrane protein